MENLKAKQETVLANAGNRGGQATLQGGEVESAVAFVDLHGIAATHGDVRLGFAEEVGEFAANTGAAIGRAFGNDGLKATGPDVGGDEPTVEAYRDDRTETLGLRKTSREAMRLTTGPRTPMVSQVSSTPMAAEESMRQARQAVWPGRMTIVRP